MRAFLLTTFLVLLNAEASRLTELTQWRLAVDGSGNWSDVQVPCTVMACLIQNGGYENVMFDQNIFSVNATAFNLSWWYTTTFLTPASKYTKLLFRGINYRANIYVNDRLISDNTTVVGTFRYYAFDVTNFAKPVGENNTLSVQVFRQFDRALPSTNHDIDLGITFVDWAPPPPDNNLGLWREVYVLPSDGVNLDFPLAQTKVDVQRNTAALTLAVEVFNDQHVQVSAVIVAVVYSPSGKAVASVSQQVILSAANRTTVVFNPTNYATLNFANPLLWWPWQMGDQPLYSVEFNAVLNGQISDALNTTFGMREVSSEIDQFGNRQYFVNGKRLLVRGAGWSPDLFLRYDPTTIGNHLAYVRQLNLNTLRLEGKFPPEYFFSQADQLGLLVMVGWCCCDAWQHWSYWGSEQYTVSTESMRSQVLRLRSHPSILTFMLSSDELPPPNVEQEHTAVAMQELWPNTLVAAASAGTSNISGPTGVKMSGPYSWEPPSYWLDDNGQFGGAWGFLTEGGPGENPMVLPSLQRTVPASSLWPPSPTDCWGHCANPQGLFYTLTRFNKPLTARYGSATGINDYLQKAHAQAYEAQRAMYEAYSQRKYNSSTGVIHWMLNSAWPSGVWHLYDYYMTPGPAFFATRKACEPLHAQYSYKDASVWLVNSMYTQSASVQVAVTVRFTNASVYWSKTSPVLSADPDSSTLLFSIPSPADMLRVLGPNSTYFVRVDLQSGSGASVSLSINDYWISTASDTLDWAASSFYYTPCATFSNFQQLMQMPAGAPIAQLANITATDLSVVLTNPYADRILFMNRLRLQVKDASGVLADVLPIMWDDNYVTLMPSEVRVLHASYGAITTPGWTPVLTVATWSDEAEVVVTG